MPRTGGASAARWADGRLGRRGRQGPVAIFVTWGPQCHLLPSFTLIPRSSVGSRCSSALECRYWHSCSAPPVRQPVDAPAAHGSDLGARRDARSPAGWALRGRGAGAPAARVMWVRACVVSLAALACASAPEPLVRPSIVDPRCDYPRWEAHFRPSGLHGRIVLVDSLDPGFGRRLQARLPDSIAALRAGWVGTVLVAVVVDTAGRVAYADTVLTSIEHHPRGVVYGDGPRLSHAQAVSEYTRIARTFARVKYTPPLLRGEPVQAWWCGPVTFRRRDE